MKNSSVKTSNRSGSTLVESSIAIGILAVAVPLVFGSMAEAGKSGASAEAETCSTWIIPACLQEIENSRASKSQYFTATETGQTFPPENEIWALAFCDEGMLVDKITIAQYEDGIKKLNNKSISHLARIDATKSLENDGMIELLITLEYPAIAPAGQRRKLDFRSLIP